MNSRWKKFTLGLFFHAEIDEKNDSKEVTIGDPFEIVFAADTPGALFSCSVYGPDEVTASLQYQDSLESKHVTRYEMNFMISIISIMIQEKFAYLNFERQSTLAF